MSKHGFIELEPIFLTYSIKSRHSNLILLGSTAFYLIQTLSAKQSVSQENQKLNRNFQQWLMNG